MRRSSGELAFEQACTYMGLDIPEIEYKFAKDMGRHWRADFAWPDKKVLVEVDGGKYIRGRHQRPQGFEDDLEKMNAATILGWRVLRFTPDMLREDPVGCITILMGLLDGGEYGTEEESD